MTFLTRIDRIEWKLDLILRQQRAIMEGLGIALKEMNNMSLDLSKLQAELEADTNATNAVLTLVQQMAAALQAAAAGATNLTQLQSQVDAMATQLQANASALSAAVTANTPAAPVVPPAPPTAPATP